MQSQCIRYTESTAKEQLFVLDMVGMVVPGRLEGTQDGRWKESVKKSEQIGEGTGSLQGLLESSWNFLGTV